MVPRQSKKKISSRKYLPTLSELVDRLSIVQLKEVFISEHKKEYSEEIQDILHDINMILDGEESIILDADLIRSILVVGQYNLHIWVNETQYRKEGKGGNLELTHSLNGIRNIAKNRIQDSLGSNARKDYKIDCLASDALHWKPSGW